MFPRYFFALCALVLFVSVVNISAEEKEKTSDAVEDRNPALAIAVRVLGAAFRWAAEHCLKEAASNCKSHWKNPKALVNCARGFLEANKGRCAVG